MSDVDATIAALEERLRRHPADRAPVIHATTRLQLGMALLHAGRYDRAEAELASAAGELTLHAAPREHATALNALGVVCRDTARPELAGELFARAAEAYARVPAPLERGATLHNLGLSRLDRGDHTGAVTAFRDARALLDRERAPAQLAATLRELGSALLRLDELDEAVVLLTEAADLAGRSGDLAGEGGAANSLGLACLARADVPEAVAAFERAVAANPRTLRAGAHAMARANLALAYESAGDAPRARLAAGQALAIADAPPAVRDQAEEIRARLGEAADDLHRVLDGLPAERWEPQVRAEVDRWTLLDDEPLGHSVRDWVDGTLRRDGERVERTAALLGSLLELPPDPMLRLVAAIVADAVARPEEAHDRIRGAVSRALARFPIPQWMRLKDAFVQASGDGAWG